MVLGCRGQLRCRLSFPAVAVREMLRDTCILDHASLDVAEPEKEFKMAVRLSTDRMAAVKGQRGRPIRHILAN